MQKFAKSSTPINVEEVAGVARRRRCLFEDVASSTSLVELMMFTLPKPPFVEGGRWVFDPTCWCAALSSWQAVVPNRTQETKAALESKMLKLGALKKTANDKLTLDAAKFDILARAQNVNLAWRPIRGSELVKFDMEILLALKGHIYVIVFLGDSQHMGGPVSHARVLYSVWNEMKVAYFLDPALNDVAIDFREIARSRFILGMARERSGFLEGDGWINQQPGGL
jgi:hypothetical protein